MKKITKYLFFACVLLCEFITQSNGMYFDDREGCDSSDGSPLVQSLDEKLLDAANYGDVALVTRLLASKANPNVQSHVGMTALMHASSWGMEEAVQVLLEARANIMLHNRYGGTVFDYAVSNVNPLLIEAYKKIVADAWLCCPLEIIDDVLIEYIV
jgi:hypothetical protein